MSFAAALSNRYHLAGFEHRVSQPRLPVLLPIPQIENVELDVFAAIVAVPFEGAVIVPACGFALAQRASATAIFFAFVWLIGTIVIAIGH
ncbi:hypothetical protein D3C73_1345900 [compost metagenome]